MRKTQEWSDKKTDKIKKNYLNRISDTLTGGNFEDRRKTWINSLPRNALASFWEQIPSSLRDRSIFFNLD